MHLFLIVSLQSFSNRFCLCAGRRPPSAQSNVGVDGLLAGKSLLLHLQNPDWKNIFDRSIVLIMSDGNRSVTHEVYPHVNQPAHLVLQWLNQSHNACVNYSNRNASKVRRPQLSSSDMHSFCHLAVVKTSHLFFTPAGPSFQICPGLPGSGDQRSLHCCEFP